jgi:hypothetical protein
MGEPRHEVGLESGVGLRGFMMFLFLGIRGDLSGLTWGSGSLCPGTGAGLGVVGWYEEQAYGKGSRKRFMEKVHGKGIEYQYGKLFVAMIVNSNRNSHQEFLGLRTSLSWNKLYLLNRPDRLT